MTAIAKYTPTRPELLGGSSPAPTEIEQVRVRLRLTHRKRLPFLHGAVVHGLLCNALQRHLPPGLTPVASESGRLGFEVGDAYHFGVTAVGPEARQLLHRLREGLESLGAGTTEVRGGLGPLRSLHGNFFVEEVEAVASGGSGSVDPPGDAPSSGVARVRFLSPLRQKRSKSQATRSRSYLDRSYFPAAFFLQRLWQRWHFLSCGTHARREDIPHVSANVRARTEGLRWLDMPVQGRPEAPGRSAGMVLGGVVGELKLEGLPPDWGSLLQVMSSLHAGSSTSFGLGRFCLPDLAEHARHLDPFPPSTTLLERATGRRALYEALEKERKHLPDLDLGPVIRRLETVVAELQEGSYEPEPWTVVAGRAVPSAMDRMLQRALVDQLGPLYETVRRSQGRAHRWPREKPTVEDLATLLPLEPAVELLNRWSQAPVHLPGLGPIPGPVGNVEGPLSELLTF